MPVCTQEVVRTPSGEELPPRESMIYLVSTIRRNGKFGCEVSRKLGAAAGEFRALAAARKHSSIRMNRKMQLFDALILSKLCYGVASAWLSKADLRRLDGFQAKCLRMILRIGPSFLSRISNERVRQQGGQTQLSKRIRQAQLKLLGQVQTHISSRQTGTEEHCLSQRFSGARNSCAPQACWTSPRRLDRPVHEDRVS